MRIICLQENLKIILNDAQNIIGRNLTLPILNNLLIQTDNNKIKVSSTNLEIGICAWAPGKIEKEGSITCPAKILTSLINSLPNKKIELDAKNNTLTIKCENYKATLKGLPADDFPIIPKIKETQLIEIRNDVLKNALTQVVGMAAVSELRPEISGVLFSFEKNSMRLVATDSFRLAEKQIFELNKNQDLNQSLIVPQRTVQELIRVLSDREGELRVVSDGSQILFDAGSVQVVSRLVDGQYPDYQQIIPKDFTTQATLDKEEFLNIVRIASLFSSKINDVNFSFQGNRLEVLSQDPDLGENKSQLAVELKGKNVEINFNFRYVLDGLNNIEAKKIFIGLNSESSPAVIRPAGDESYLYVVMPIKAN